MVVALAIAVAGRRNVAARDAELLEALRQFQGKEVTVAAGERAVYPYTGVLILGETSGAVKLVNSKTYVIRLGDIRWIMDPATGRRWGPPWWHSGWGAPR